MHLWSARSAFQDKLLEEMWKQQDSLEAPADTAAETPASPEAGGGPEENIKDSNPLLERLRALEVPPSPSAQLCLHVVSFHFWNVRLTDREYHVLFNQMYFTWSRRKLKDSTWERALLFHLPDVPSLQAFVSYFGRTGSSLLTLCRSITSSAFFLTDTTVLRPFNLLMMGNTGADMHTCWDYQMNYIKIYKAHTGRLS